MKAEILYSALKESQDLRLDMLAYHQKFPTNSGEENGEDRYDALMDILHRTVNREREEENRQEREAHDRRYMERLMKPAPAMPVTGKGKGKKGKDKPRSQSQKGKGTGKSRSKSVKGRTKGKGGKRGPEKRLCAFTTSPMVRALAVANAATDMTNQRTTKKQSTIEISILNYPLDQIRLHPRAEAKGNATSGSRADHVDSATSASSSTPTGLPLRPRARSSSARGRDRRAEQRKELTQVLQLPQLLCENYSLYAGIRVTHLDSQSPAPRSTVRLRVVRAPTCVEAARQVRTSKVHARPWRSVLRVSLS